MTECTLFNSCERGHTHCCCECQDEDRAGCICDDTETSELCEHLKRRTTQMNDQTKQIIAFMEEAAKVAKKGIVTGFKCPGCGGQAHATRSTYNGHIHAECEYCGMHVMQ